MSRQIVAFAEYQSNREQGITKVWVTFNENGKDYTVEVPYSSPIDLRNVSQITEISKFIDRLSEREINMLKIN